MMQHIATFFPFQHPHMHQFLFTEGLVPFGYLAAIWHKPNSYLWLLGTEYTCKDVVVGVGRASTRVSTLDHQVI